MSVITSKFFYILFEKAKRIKQRYNAYDAEK